MSANLESVEAAVKSLLPKLTVLAGSQEPLTITEYPFGKDYLRSTGTQYSDEYTTVADETYETVESVTIEPPVGGDIVEVELGITWSQKSDGTARYVRGRVQARNKNETWVTLSYDGTSPVAGNAYIEDTADASSYSKHTFSGRFETEWNFNKVPFDIRVQVLIGPQVAAETEHALGKVKNSSYIRVKYNAS